MVNASLLLFSATLSAVRKLSVSIDVPNDVTMNRGHVSTTLLTGALCTRRGRSFRNPVTSRPP